MKMCFCLFTLAVFGISCSSSSDLSNDLVIKDRVSLENKDVVSKDNSTSTLIDSQVISEFYDSSLELPALNNTAPVMIVDSVKVLIVK